MKLRNLPPHGGGATHYLRIGRKDRETLYGNRSNNSLLISDLSFHVDLSLGGQKFKITITQLLLKLEP